MTIQLSEVSAADQARCVALLHDADEDDARTLAAMSAPDHIAYLAADGPQTVGAAMMHWLSDEPEIAYLAVAAEARRRGYGRAILEALVEMARGRGCRAVVVGTANSNIGNITFYQKCGFRMDHVRRGFFDYLTQPVYENGIPLRDMIVFRRSLD